MSEKQSIWSKADVFLTKTRKIIVNSLTALVLIIITFSTFGSLHGSFILSIGKTFVKVSLVFLL